MRQIESADLLALRGECCAEFVGDQRADDVFDLAIEWLRHNPLPRAADQFQVNEYRRHCAHAVSFRARNEERMGVDAIEWTEMCSAIIGHLMVWMIDAP